MSQRSWTPLLAPALMVVGLGLLGLGWGWGTVVPTSTYWGPEQAEEYIDAQAELHDKTHDRNHNSNHEQDFAAARERFVKISQQLADARVSRDRTGTILAYGGFVAILAGLAWHYTAGRAA